jgi:hypothetical protein
MFTKRNVTARFETNPSLPPAPHEYIIQRWVWGDKTHFRRPGWDPILNSQTVKNGKIDRITVYTVL